MILAAVAAALSVILFYRTATLRFGPRLHPGSDNSPLVTRFLTIACNLQALLCLLQMG